MIPFYEPIVRHVLHPLNLWWDGEAAELRYMAEFEQTQFLAADELRELAETRLRKAIKHAHQHCPYYRKRWEAHGVGPADIRTRDDLARLPVLTKRDIQENRDGLVAENWPKDDLIPNQTGGSTGTPISFFLSRDRVMSRNAATWRHNRWAGYDVGDKVAMVWGAPRDIPPNSWKHRLRNWVLDRTLYLDTAHLTETRLREFHLALKRFRPKTILAYAGALGLLARFLKSRGLDAYQPKSIITSAEVLEPNDRTLVEEVFGCPVFDRYGSREVAVIASECVEHASMHVMGEGLVVEVVQGDRPALPGTIGKILITDLLNPVMPLIRYQIGDMGAWATGTCRCGRHLRRLEKIAGRVTDFVVGADGRLVSGVFLATYIVAHRPSLGQVQISQDRTAEICYRIVRVEGRQPSAEDLEFLTSATKEYCGPTMRVDFEFVDGLPSEPSGKFLFCRSTVSSDFMDLRQNANSSP